MALFYFFLLQETGNIPHLFFLLMMIIVVMFFHRSTEIHRGKQGEHVRLQETHQQFEHAHEHRKGNGQHRYTVTKTHIHLGKNENKAEKRKRDDVTRQDVGEQSYHQYKRLKEHPEDLDGSEQHQHTDGHTRHSKNVTPVRGFGAEGGDHKHNGGKGHGHRDVAGNVGPTGNNRDKSKQVGEPDEKENGEQERQILFIMFFANGGLCDLVTHKDDERLYYRLQAFGGGARPARISLRSTHKDPGEQDHHKNNGGYVFGDGKVPQFGRWGLIHVAVRIHHLDSVFNELVLMLSFHNTFFQLVREENIQAFVGVKDHRQRQRKIACNMPFVGINNVTDDELTGIEFFLLSFFVGFRCGINSGIGVSAVALRKSHARGDNACCKHQ